MLKLNAVSLLAALSRLISIKNVIRFHRDKEDGDIAGDNSPLIVGALKDFCISIESIGARYTTKSVERILNKINSGDMSYRILSEKLDDIESRLLDELEDMVIFAIPKNNVSRLESGISEFGKNVVEKFPDCLYDLEEASKCLALGRYTACVFHLMKAIEIAIGKFLQAIGSNSTDKDGKPLTWGVMISNLKRDIDAMPPGSPRDDANEVFALLYAVKEAWRNPTMHPKRTYTEEEAVRVYDAVRNFMSSLSQKVEV